MKWAITFTHTGVLLVTILLLIMGQPVYAQEPATPIPVNPPTGTATAPPPTDPPTRTPTSQGPASVEALADGTNIRSQPDISAERLGQISPGQSYAVIGRFFEWLQIEYPDTPGGTGWVHESVVTINGDPNLIRDFSQQDVPTENPTIVSRRQTADAITATPGGVLTITAQALITPEGIFTVAAGAPQPGAPQIADGILPTFTFPPETPTPLNLQDYNRQSSPGSADGGIAPMIPILGLIGAGIFGLIISLLRKN